MDLTHPSSEPPVTNLDGAAGTGNELRTLATAFNARTLQFHCRSVGEVERERETDRERQTERARWRQAERARAARADAKVARSGRAPVVSDDACASS